MELSQTCLVAVPADGIEFSQRLGCNLRLHAAHGPFSNEATFPQQKHILLKTSLQTHICANLRTYILNIYIHIYVVCLSIHVRVRVYQQSTNSVQSPNTSQLGPSENVPPKCQSSFSQLVWGIQFQGCIVGSNIGSQTLGKWPLSAKHGRPKNTKRIHLFVRCQ